ncbi:hypothetical protein ACJDT4_13250 [Clostridium neuense]|uniref:Uncharacterized protein n=1 Tax=Clostridium neuense TaxID=1728934 RepID=A0ABW8TKB9_9CLOT
MKTLEIKANNCFLYKTDYGVSINGEGIERLVKKNLPEELKDYKDYPVKVNIQIEIMEDEKLTVSTGGYEIRKEESEENANE